MVATTRSKFWGPHFPDVWDTSFKFWGPHFPDPGPALDEVTPTTPAGVATFVLDLDATMTMTLEYQTDIFKADNGIETRAAVLDLPRRRIKGSALLIGGASVRQLRTKLQRWAAQGATFALGLPFEALRLSADAVDEALAVGSLASCDWANPGQRVVVVGKNRTAINAVIQSASGTSITLDIAPGTIGAEGGSVMPTVPIHLAPQQGFQRYTPSDGIERWVIDASVASFGWRKAAVAAILDLEAAGAVSCTGLFVQARTTGADGNSIRVAMVGDLDPLSSDDVSIDEVGNDVTIHFISESATVQELADAINLHSTLVRAIGSWNGPFELQETSDEFALTNLAGGSDGDYATEGTGAVVATHAGVPVFDRGLLVSEGSTADDSMQAMNEIVTHGGLQENTGHATTPDWGRSVGIGDKLGPEFQWLKRFLDTVRGRQVAFWLPTWRNDLVAVSAGVGELTIESPAEEDFFAWFATRQNIQIRQVDGTITYATITAAVDNGDGTITLTTGVTLSGSAVEVVSWLELCHFEDDAIDVAFAGHLFSASPTARAVQQ